MNDILEDYYEWMCSLIEEGKPNRHSYEMLLRSMFSREFSYILPMDSNRYEDGIDLRYRFAYECDIPESMVSNNIDYTPCTIFEMMVALSLRCEEHIMNDPDVGDRTGQWFWEMIESLGLMEMYDSRFDLIKVDHILTNFMERKFSKNGKGGLFTVNNDKVDMRNEEIWYQMMWHLDEEVQYEW